jgi:hypothetical protein
MHIYERNNGMRKYIILGVILVNQGVFGADSDVPRILDNSNVFSQDHFQVNQEDSGVKDDATVLDDSANLPTTHLGYEYNNLPKKKAKLKENEMKAEDTLKKFVPGISFFDAFCVYGNRAYGYKLPEKYKHLAFSPDLTKNFYVDSSDQKLCMFDENGNIVDSKGNVVSVYNQYLGVWDQPVVTKETKKRSFYDELNFGYDSDKENSKNLSNQSTKSTLVDEVDSNHENASYSSSRLIK